MKVFLGKWTGLVAATAALAGAIAGPMAAAARAQSSGGEPVDRKEARREADRMLAQGKYAEAKAAYDRLAPEGSAPDDRLRYRRAFAAAKTGDLATAGSDYSAVADSATGRLAGSALLRRAEVAERAGDDAAAQAAFSRLAQTHLDHPQAGVALTRILAHIGKAKTAGRLVPPGLVLSAELLASHGAGAGVRWRGPSGAAAPPVIAPVEKKPPPVKNPGPAKKPAPRPPPAKAPQKPRARPGSP